MRSGFRRLAVAALALVTPLALAATAPAITAPRSGDPPVVDLDALRVSGGVVSAPARGGGRAELTLEPHLQQISERLLARAKPIAGAVVLVQARTGRVLALAQRGGHDVVRSANAPAASVFKIVTTAALLRHSPIGLDTRVCTSGGLRRIDLEHLQSPRGGALCAPFGDALGHSRNAVFAQLAARHLEPEELIETAESLGFNGTIPLNGPVRVGTAHAPDGELGFARMAAGFVGTTLSPIGGAHLAYVIASGGISRRMSIVSHAGAYRAPERAEDLGRVMPAAVAEELRRMMEVTVREGTSFEAFRDAKAGSYLGGIRVAGKTGTLQPSAHDATTSWFVGFAPSRDPEVIVSVLLQNPARWHQKANEVARDALRAYYSGRRRGVTPPI